MQELSASTNRFGDYILHDRIGAGGMAEIFLATATGIEGFEKRVVIKRILPSLSDDEQFVRMFIEEAKLCVALRHPNIVQVHDLGEIDAQYYIAMEYVDGRDLLKTLAACGKKKIGFPTDIALFIVMEVLKGLQYAHQLKKPNGEPLGIIHRDVSPSNVLLSFEGEVKIGDFGIAKANTREKTATGILKGKFGYMAPEQVTGVPIDSRADIFAVGIVMYELLTGHRLFAGKNDLAVLEKVRDARIEPAPKFYRQDLDPELENIVLRALSRDAGDRYQTAHDLHDAIHDYVYRSRATVGPAHLARFMQTLFLNDPEEIDRRSRVKLPQPRAFPAGGVPANGTNGARNGSVNGRMLELVTGEGDFDEKTPLLDPAELPGSPLSSAVAFISDVDSWERAGSSALIEYSLAEGDASGAFSRPSPPPPPPLTRVPRIESNGLSTSGESTARTDVEIELENAIQIDDSARSPQARVAALRASVENESPTDLDLSEDSKRMVAEADKKSLPRALETVLNRRPTPERKVSAATLIDGEALDEDAEDTTQKKDDPEDDDYYHDPSDIVERTVSTGGEDDELDADEELTSEVEPTVRFDSSQFPAARDELDDGAGTTATNSFSEERTREDDAEETAREREGYESVGDDPSGGTLQLEESDLPTAEVPEDVLRADLVVRSETDTIPSPSTSTPDTEADESLVSPILDDDDVSDPTVNDADPPSAVIRPRTDSMFSELTDAEEMAFGAEDDTDPPEKSVSSAKRAVAEIRRARRASRMANELAKEEARGPSRRRPITSRRPRPLLLPSEEEAGEPALNQRQSLQGSKRRRQTATRSLSVVNPAQPRQPSLRRPIVQAKAREDSDFATDETGSGFLVDEETQSGEMAAAEMPAPVVDTPKRRGSSGVTSALSEAAKVDEEIQEIRKSTSRGGPPDDQTTPQRLYHGDDEYDPDFDEEDTKQGVKVKEAIQRIQSRKRIVTQSFVLYGDKQASFGDDDSEGSAPLITSAGRLEDEGASDLFGVLEVLDNGTLDELGFSPEEEVSLETESRDYGSGETKLGLLAGEDEVFGEEPTASVTDGDVLSISQLLRNSSVPLEPDVMEVSGESSGISISLEPEDRSDSEVDLLTGKSDAFEFEFTENDEPTQEQDDAEKSFASARRKSMLDMPAGLMFVDETSNQRPARLISDSFELEKNGEPRTSKPEGKAPPVRPVSMIEPPDTRTVHPDDEPARAKASNASALRRVVQRHKVAKEVRTKGTPAGAIPAPIIPPLVEPSPIPAPAKGSRAAPSARAFYPPAHAVEVRSAGALNKFATFAVLIAVLLAVAAAVSILLQNRARVPIPPMESTEIPTEIPAEPPSSPMPPKEPPPAPKAPAKEPAAPPPAEALKPPPAPPRKPEVERAPPPPKAPKKKPARAKKRKRAAAPPPDRAVIRISCSKPIDIKISSIGTIKQRKRYSRRVKPGDYRVTLIDGGQRRSFDVSLVPGDPVIIRCPF